MAQAEAGTLPVKFIAEFDDPQLDINIQNYEEKFYLGTVAKKGFRIFHGDGFKTVDISNLYGTLAKIIVIPHDTFDPPSETTLKIHVDDGVYAAYDITLHLEKYLNYNVSRYLAPYITGMSLACNSLTSVKIDVILTTFIDAPPVA